MFCKATADSYLQTKLLDIILSTIVHRTDQQILTMSSSPAHHVSSSPSKMKASKLLPAGEDLKRTAESMSGGEMQPIKRVKPTKRDRNQIAPTRAQTIRRKVAPKSKPLLFTSDRVNNRPDAAPLQYLSDSSHTYVPLPRLANGGCIVDSVAQNTSSAPSQHHVISRAPEESIVDSLIQQRDREITALKLELENSEMLRREGVAHEAFLREQLRDTEESLREKLKSKAAKGKAYKQKCMDLEARFDDLSQRHYTLERNHKVVKEDKQLAEKKAKIFEDAFGIVKDREIQQASYVIFEGRKVIFLSLLANNVFANVHRLHISFHIIMVNPKSPPKSRLLSEQQRMNKK